MFRRQRPNDKSDSGSQDIGVHTELLGLYTRIEEEYKQHRPLHSHIEEYLPLGSHGTHSRAFICESCGQQWPCKIWHLLRWIYSDRKETYRLRLQVECEEEEE